MQIRFEELKDHNAVWSVNEAAFETSAEANLVNLLRAKKLARISLVAELSGSVVGHILFSQIQLSGKIDCRIMGLGPMAILPTYQRQGIGSALVWEGLKRCTDSGFGAVVVLGHPGFYPRFGFMPGSRFGLSSGYDVPDDVFMAVELQPGYLQGVSGRIYYDEAFDGV